MAVQKSKKTPSRRGMRRSHDALSSSSLSLDSTTGEVHLRHNPDFEGGVTEFIPVWEGEDTTAPTGFKYREYPDVHGRIGAFVR